MDFSEYSTEQLIKMEAAAYADYYRLATRIRPAPPTREDLIPLEKATDRWEQIQEELFRREGICKEPILEDA